MLTGLYQIQYADGTAAENVLVENENIFGWTRAPGAEVPRSAALCSRVAWTGTTKLFPVICVCQMLWVNPKPEMPVKAVRFANPQKNMCPVLIAPTAVRQGECRGNRRDAGESKAVAEEGHRRIDAETRGALQRRFRRLAADPKLGYLTIVRELEDAATTKKASSRRTRPGLLPAGSRTPLPYNKIGQMLERQGDAEARSARLCPKSLEIQWNQPPIIEAKSRLTQQMKK